MFQNSTTLVVASLKMLQLLSLTEKIAILHSKEVRHRSVHKPKPSGRTNVSIVAFASGLSCTLCISTQTGATTSGIAVVGTAELVADEADVAVVVAGVDAGVGAGVST